MADFALNNYTLARRKINRLINSRVRTDPHLTLLAPDVFNGVLIALWDVTDIGSPAIRLMFWERISASQHPCSRSFRARTFSYCRINSVSSGQGISLPFARRPHFQKFATVAYHRYKKDCQLTLEPCKS
jgi:hypothetical protein